MVLIALAGGLAAKERPATWASPMEPRPGLENFFRVSDQLYRGAQPKKEGFDELKKLGIRTVVNLRTSRSDEEECRDAGLKYFPIPVKAREVGDEEVIEFLKVATNPENQPVFVHCRHGADRAGVMSAAYRVAVQGWSKEEAIEEMTRGGFRFHSIFRSLVDYIREMDVESAKRLSGMAIPGHLGNTVTVGRQGQ